MGQGGQGVFVASCASFEDYCSLAFLVCYLGFATSVVQDTQGDDQPDDRTRLHPSGI